MKLELYTSAFCAPCHAARAVVAEAQALVPALVVNEADVAARPDAAGAPRLDQVLGALALAV
jgi:thioredoxin 1